MRRRVLRGIAVGGASVGASGIMSFLVNQGGIVLQKDFGPPTATRRRDQTA